MASPAPAALAPGPPSAGGSGGPGRFVARLGRPRLARHPSDFVTRHLPRACDVRRVLDAAVAQLSGQALDLVGRPLECLGEGCLRQMPSPAVEAEHPDPPRLVMTRHDGPGPVVDLRLTRLALIPRSRRWGRVATRLGAVGSAAGGTDHTSGPAALPDGVATLRVLKEMRDVPDQVSVA